MKFSEIPLPSRLALLCIFGFVINFATFYPGFLSPDSLDQYGQALAGQYRTWHPPVMAFVWHILNFFYKGPQMMLALQLFFLWMSCYLIASSLRNKYWRGGMVLLFLFAPFIQNFAGWVLKDTQMTFSWLLAAAIIFKSMVTGRKQSVVAAIGCAMLLTYGTWLRYNAIVALPPLCIAWAWTVFVNQKKVVRLAYAVGLFLIVFFGQNFFNEKILNAAKENTDIQIYFHDIAGVYVKFGKNYFPPEMWANPDFDTAYIRAHYNQVDVTALLWNPDNKQILAWNMPGLNEKLRASWMKMIKEEPGYYIRHRNDIYEYFLALKRQGPPQYYFAWMHPNDYGFVVAEGYLYKLYNMYMERREDQLIFRVWFWVLLNVLLLPMVFLIRNTQYRIYYLAVVLSGFLYTLPQYVVANTVRDFRYIYWACFACIIGVVTILVERLKNREVNLP